MALGSTQPLTEMSTRSISWGKGGRCVRLTILPPSCAIVTQSGNLNFLEFSGPLQACNRTALCLYSGCIFFSVVERPNSGFGSFVIEVAVSTSDQLVTEVASLSIHALSGIRTRDPRNRAAANLRLRLHLHWDRLA